MIYKPQSLNEQNQGVYGHTLFIKAQKANSEDILGKILGKYLGKQ